MGVTATFAIVIVFADDLLRGRSLGRKYVRTEHLHVFLLHRIERGRKLIEHCFSFAPSRQFSPSLPNWRNTGSRWMAPTIRLLPFK